MHIPRPTPGLPNWKLLMVEPSNFLFLLLNPGVSDAHASLRSLLLNLDSASEFPDGLVRSMDQLNQNHGNNICVFKSSG